MEKTIDGIRQELLEFLEKREWHRFHTPKDLALAVQIEAGELAEHFLWKDEEECTNYLADEGKRARVLEEVADVMIYVLNMVNAIERLSGEKLNITTVIRNKIRKNEEKYPAELYRNKARLEKPG